MITRWLERRRAKLQRHTEITALVLEIRAVQSLSGLQLERLVNAAGRYAGALAFLEQAKQAFMAGVPYGFLIKFPPYQWSGIAEIYYQQEER